MFQVRTAVQFLVNPKVKESTKEHKTTFLKKKGLSENEIDLAFQRSDAPSKDPSVPVRNFNFVMRA